MNLRKKSKFKVKYPFLHKIIDKDLNFKNLD